MIKIIVFCVLLAIISSICKANVVDNVSVRDFYEPRLNRKDDSKRLGNHAKRHFHIYQDTSISKKISSIEIVGAGPPAEDGSADIMSSVFNLSKTILGAGILSLPAAVAAFSDQVSSLPLACALLVVMGAISAYSFSSIGKACQQHGVRNFKDAWAASVHPNSGLAISIMITMKTLFSCLAYTIIIGDSFSSFLKAFGVPTWASDRDTVMWTLMSTIVFPLCLLKSLDALKYTSILGLLGILYCAAFMGIRRFDGSYSPGGKYFTDIAAKMQPSFGVKGTVLDEKVFILLSTIATAYVAHYNAPKFWSELKNRSAKRYDSVVISAFTFAAVMYFIVMIIGFTTFGGHSSGFILNNYSSKDILATLGRLAIGGGILFGYPLTFTALYDGLMEIIRVVSGSNGQTNSNNSRILWTVAVLGGITSVAMKLRNLGLVLSLSGSLIGSALIYVIPALMNINNLPKKSLSVQKYSPEMLLNYFIVAMGIAVAIVGVKTTLQGAGH